jgi:hypothetical protein
MLSAVEIDHTEILVLPLLPIIIMLLIGAAIVLQVLLSARAQKLSLRALVPVALSCVWLLPIVAVMGYVALQTTRHFQTSSSRPIVVQSGDALYTCPMHPQIRLSEPDRCPICAMATNPTAPIAEAAGGHDQTSIVPVSTKASRVELIRRRNPGDATDKPQPEVLSETKSTLPEWVRNASQSTTFSSHKLSSTVGGDDSKVVLSSQRFATIEDAKKQVIDVAVEQVRDAFHRTHPYRGQWELPADLVDAEVVKHRYVEEIEHDFGSFTGRMYRVHLQLDLDSSTGGPIYRSWRDQVVERRLWLLGSLLGLVTLVLGTTTAYLRLDTMTQGQYRSRLRLAATLLITAGGFAAAAVIPRV